MSNKAQETIEEAIRKNRSLITYLEKATKELEEKASLLQDLELSDFEELEKILKKIGKTGIDFQRYLEFEEYNLLKFAHEDFLLVYVPFYEIELLQDIGNVGKFVTMQDNYVAFKFDKTTDPRWKFPAIIEEDVKPYLPTGFEQYFSVKDGVVTFKPEDREKVKEKYGKYLTDIQEQSATIKPTKYFDFMIDLSENGYFVFDSGAYPKELFRTLDTPNKILMNSEVAVKEGTKTKVMDLTYQKEIVEALPYHRHATLGLKTGSGKSFITMAFFRKLKGKKLVLVDSDLARSQWQGYIETWIPEIKNEVHVDTYNMIVEAYNNKSNDLWKLIKDTYFSLIVFDEGERVFNEQWGRSLTQKTEGRLFLTATPFPRNIKSQILRGNYFGKMFATDWKSIMKAQKKEFAVLRVNILSNDKEKIARLIDRVVSYKDKKQLVFCQWKQKEGEITGYDLANKLSKTLGRKISFIHGDIKGDRLAKLENHLANDGIVVSTLGYRTISMKQLEVVHIFNPFASETTGIQQLGRLAHSLFSNKFGEMYFKAKDIQKEDNQTWLTLLLTKGYQMQFPDGRPRFEKKTTTLQEDIAQTIVSSIKEKELTTPIIDVIETSELSTNDIDSYFDHAIVKERIEELKQARINQKGKTLEILGLLSIYPKLTYQEIIEKLKVKKSSQGNISTAISNLVDWGFVIKDTSNDPYVIQLDFNSLNTFAREKKEKQLLEAKMKKFGLKT